MTDTDSNNSYITLGWREWISLPDLGLPLLKAKTDTGARTSCLHAFDVEPFMKDGKEWVRFGVHPHQRDDKTEAHCEAEVLDKRMVSDSGGHKESRYVILTNLVMGKDNWPIEITLTNRDNMLFRFLLGRTAMRKRVIVDPGASFLLGKQKIKS